MTVLEAAKRSARTPGRSGPRPYISAAIVAFCSLCGAVVFPITAFRTAVPWTAPLQWWGLLVAIWAGLVVWAAAYGYLLHRASRVERGKALLLTAMCQLPLLLCLLLAASVYRGDSFGQFFLSSPVGTQLYQLLARDYVVLAPLGMQLLVLAVVHRSWIRSNALILTILAISLGLRLSHAAWGLPGLLHPDEHRYIGPAVIMVARTDFHPHYFENPSLMIYLTTFLFWALTDHSIAFHTLDQAFNLGIPDPRGDYFQMVMLRATVALSGVATVGLVYLVGRKLVGKRAALLGALVLGVSFLHVRNSHYATNDIVATFLLMASFAFAVRIYERGQMRDYLLAGLIGGLGTSTKYNIGIFAAAIVVAHIGFLVREKRYGVRRSLLPLVLSGAISLVGFVAGTPYSVLDYRAFHAGFVRQLGYGDIYWRGQDVRASALLFVEALGQGVGVIPLLFAVVGLVWLARDRWKLALILAVPVTYMGFMATQNLFFARFAIPILPFLVILIGCGLDRAIELVAANRRTLVASGLVALTVAQSLVFVWRHDVLIGRTDTRLLSEQWIAANLPSDGTMAIEGYSPADVKFGWKPYEMKVRWIYWPERPEWVARATSGEFRYVVVCSLGYGPWQTENDPPSKLPDQYGRLEREGKLLASFSPGPSNTELSFALDDTYSPFWHLFDRELPGPTIRIYELPQPASGQPQ